jgi:two-component system, OmpR family, sensor kinase
MTGQIKKVLLVEDNPGDALLLREALKDLGGSIPFDLVHVSRLDEGLQAVKKDSFDAVLLDLSLPDARGVETVVRMLEATPQLPVVVLTGLDDDIAALDAVRAGAQDYLVKGQIDGRLLVRALSYAIERKRAQEEIERHLHRIVALKDVNTALSSTLDLPSVLEILLHKVVSLMPECGVAVRLWNEERLMLELAACRNLDEEAWKTESLQAEFEGGLTEEVFRTKTLLIIDDMRSDARMGKGEFHHKHGVRAYVCVPLLVEDQVLGLLSFYSKAHKFGDQEIEFLGALASQASVAIRNSQVHGQMKQLVERLDRSNRIKEEFLGVISHELRTPLNIVKGYVQLLQTKFFGDLAPEQDAAIEKIAVQTKEQLDMINEILQAVSIESEVTIVNADRVPLQDFLRELQSMYFSLHDRPLSFHWNDAPQLPVVQTDKTKLKYILNNLINNAAKFTPAGHVTVSTTVLDSDPTMPYAPASENGTVWIKFDVADTGIGIPKEFLPLIFEKFSQVDSSTTRTHGGIGLGLHIVKRCVELLHGTINVESEPGNGSIFSVKIPCELWNDAMPASMSEVLGSPKETHGAKPA